MALSTNTLGILFARVDTSSDLKATIGEWLVSQRIAQMTSIISEIVNKHGGIVSKNLTGALLCTFPGADATASAAIEIQESNGDLDSTQNQAPLGIKIALNFGQMAVAAGNIAGEEINAVVQLMNSVEDGQILSTNKLTNALSDNANVSLVEKDILKASENPQGLRFYELSKAKSRRSNTAPTIPPPVPEPKKRPVKTPVKEVEVPSPPTGRLDKLVIIHDGKKHEITSSAGQITIGRAKENDIVVNKPYVSRKHVRIESVDGEFVIINTGTNGTYIRSQKTQSEVHCVKQTMIQGDSEFSPGCPLDDANALIIYCQVS